MANYDYAKVVECADYCLEELVKAWKDDKSLSSFRPGELVEKWARKNGIREEDIKSFVKEVRETVEGELLTYGLTEDLLERRKAARERSRRMLYSGVYTLFESRQKSPKIEEYEED